MVKKLLIAVFCGIFFNLNAQNGTISPYSFFGIGDLRDNGTVENQMMGGLMMIADSIHVNLRNPAAYSKLIFTTYTAGISHREFRLKDFTEQQNIAVTNLDYLAIGFPVANKVGVGFGLMPFSSVGYQLVQESVNASGSDVINAFTGEGGINRVYVSVGFEPLKNLSIGATASFNFGMLENQRLQTVENVQFGTFDNRESRINGFDFNYSLLYKVRLKQKYSLHTFLGINTQTNLTSENSARIGSVVVANGTEIEGIDVNLDAQNLRRTELKIPTTFTGGLGFGQDKKWFLGAEYGIQKMSEFENRFLGLENVRYQDASTFAFGGFFIPKYDALSGYFNRITYRAGLRYHVSGLVVNEKEINNFGITFGLGLPLSNFFSNVNLGFELGRRGTTDANLVEESYLGINIGLSLNDRWFIKRKIN